MVIYADILFCLNLLVNYFLLLAAGRFCRIRLKRRRVLLAAAFGALYAMVLFIDGIPPWALLLSKLLVSAIMLRIAFVFAGAWQFAREYIIFFVVNFLFAGLMLALWLCAAPAGMVFYNGIVYFNISTVTLVAFTAISYGLAELFSRLYKRRGTEGTDYTVVLELAGRQALLAGFLDTGNTLREPYTGYPVAVCDAAALSGVLPKPALALLAKEGGSTAVFEELQALCGGVMFKLVPYTSVGYSGILPAFMPQRLTLQNGGNTYVSENVYIAVSPQRLYNGGCDILLNTEMLTTQKKHMQEHL